MEYKFLEKPVNPKDPQKTSQVDLCLQENNESKLSTFFEFLEGSDRVLFVNGFRGCGKTEFVDFVTGFTSDDVIKLRYTCFETTICDDILLSFFLSFRNLVLQGKISPPKLKAENFNQKTDSYFNSTNLPILVVMDSFDSVMKENLAEIIGFLKHLLDFPNVKLILIGKTLPTEEFADIRQKTVTLLAFSQKIYEKYLRENGIKQIGVISNELYKLSKGYYRNIKLSVILMRLRKLSLSGFLELYSKSYMSFSEFLVREAIGVIDPVSIHLFRLLAVMRIPIHKKLLKTLRLYDEEKIKFFTDNSILECTEESYYLKEAFRDELERLIPENVAIKIHGSCIDLYNTQLPLKPLERDLMISRKTMRSEMDYHALFIPKKPVPEAGSVRMITVDGQGISFRASTPAIADISAPVPETPEAPAIPEQNSPSEENKEERINKISFIIEDNDVLENIAGSIKDYMDEAYKNAGLKEKSSGMTVTEILNAAKSEENSYNYKSAIILYQTALTRTDDEDYYTFLPIIYTKSARAHQKLSEWYDAVNCYTSALDFYENISNIEKSCEIKLELANVYYNMYKQENAKVLLSSLEKVANLPNELTVRINIACAKLSGNINSEYNYYKKSLQLLDSTVSKKVICELYYRYAVACDELDDIRAAAEYYKKCIETESDYRQNHYLSRALSNLAELYYEAGSVKAAVKYYNESIKIDETARNYNGLYLSASHLADIYSSTSEDKTFEYLHKALEYAKLMNEPFYIASAELELGDYYYLKRNYENAYKYFVMSLASAKNVFPQENTEKIYMRLDDVKRRVSESEFEGFGEKYGK